MRRTALAVALLITLMGFALPVQAGENSDRARTGVADNREATQHNTDHVTTTDNRNNPTPSINTRTGEATAESTAVKAQTKWIMRLSGEAEVPDGSGDPDGSGVAGLRIRVDEAGLCYSIRVSDIDAVVAAHIHEGGVDVDGPVVIDLAITAAETTTHNGTTAFWQCLTGLDATLLAEIEANPAEYYVNVHTSAFPDGAVRGQLLQAAANRR